MTNTYKAIASTTVGAGGTSSIIFSNISQNYADLLIKWSLRNSYSTNFRMNINISFNAVSSGYNSIYLNGNASGTGTAANATGTNQIYSGEIPSSTGTANTFAVREAYISEYTVAKNKNISIENFQESNQTSDVFTSIITGVMASTAAISTITITPGAGTFAQYSMATLYGIKKS